MDLSTIYLVSVCNQRKIHFFSHFKDYDGGLLIGILRDADWGSALPTRRSPSHGDGSLVRFHSIDRTFVLAPREPERQQQPAVQKRVMVRAGALLCPYLSTTMPIPDMGTP